jgi:hypothetical protein
MAGCQQIIHSLSLLNVIIQLVMSGFTFTIGWDYYRPVVHLLDLARRDLVRHIVGSPIGAGITIRIGVKTAFLRERKMARNWSS